MIVLQQVVSALWKGHEWFNKGHNEKTTAPRKIFWNQT